MIRIFTRLSVVKSSICARNFALITPRDFFAKEVQGMPARETANIKVAFSAATVLTVGIARLLLHRALQRFRELFTYMCI